MYDIVALGESLIDFTPAGINEMGMPLFSQNPGGAPANVLAMASKLGRSTAFVGKVILGIDAMIVILCCLVVGLLDLAMEMQTKKRKAVA